MSEHRGKTGIQATVSAVVTRADGATEDLGVIATFGEKKPGGPLSRLVEAFKNRRKDEPDGDRRN